MAYYYAYEDQQYEEYVEYQLEGPDDEIYYEEPIYEYDYFEEYRPCKIPARRYANPGNRHLRDFYHRQSSLSPVYASQKCTNRSKLYVQLHHNEREVLREEEEVEEEAASSRDFKDDFDETRGVHEETDRDRREGRVRAKRRKNRVRTGFRRKPGRKLKKPNYAKVSAKTAGNGDGSGEVVVKETGFRKPQSTVNLGTSESAKFSVAQRRPSRDEDMRPKRDGSSINVSDPASQGETKTRFHSITNVRSIAEENTTSGEMVGWRRPSAADSTTESTLGLGAVASTELRHLAGALSSDCCTNVTVNSDEYRQFIGQINGMPQMSGGDGGGGGAVPRSESAPPVGIGTILKSFYDSTNTSTKVPPDVTLTTSDPAQCRKVGRREKGLCIAGRRREGRAKVNPLRDVPLLHMFEWAIPAEKPCRHRRASQELDGKAKSSSVVFRALRFLVTAIGRLQSFAYRYALRYILFI